MSNFPINPALLEVPLYIGGKSVEEVKEELGLERVVKLASNESPAGPSPLAIEAIKSALAEAHRYPGMADRDLRRKLAEYHQHALDEQNFVIGNGGTDVLRMLTQAFVFRGGNTIMSRATFPMYHILTTACGGTPRFVDPTPDYRHDLAAMLEQIDHDTRIIFLCSPNNPTGTVLSQSETEWFLERVPPEVVVVFDEAYADFVDAGDYADSLSFVADGRNVLTVRSFSKSAGLANLRVGYLIGHSEIADYVRHTQMPFHSSGIALRAAMASIADEEYRAACRRVVRKGREYLYSEISALQLECLPSQANFVCIVNLPLEASDMVDALLRRGYIVRAMSLFGMPEAVRVSVGTREQNEGFVAALAAVLAEARVAAEALAS